MSIFVRNLKKDMKPNQEISLLHCDLFAVRFHNEIIKWVVCDVVEKRKKDSFLS